MNLSFLGAAGEVTGSCYLLSVDGSRFLIDCGMFQGGRDAFQKNRNALDFDAATIDFVLLSHAHIDHCGLLPRLVARGFRGKIYATTATADLVEVMLLDSAHVQARDAERERRHRRAGDMSGGDEDTVLYDLDEARHSLRYFQPVDYDQRIEPAPGIRACFRDAGHILGSAIIEIWVQHAGGEKKLVFSGDLGEPDRPIMRDPTLIESADVLLVESTYGDRDHRTMAATYDEFAQVMTDALARRGGNVIIPAFAVGRIQEVLYVICRLAREGRLQPGNGGNGGLNIFVDSPMGTRATELTMKHHAVLDDDVLELFDLLRRGRHKQHLPHIEFTETPEESIALNRIHQGAIIIAASGMCEAGRIRHHLRQRLSHPENTIVFTGFQAAGTLGRRIVDGAKYVRLFGQDVAVRAEVATIGGLSAHAGQSGLLHWLKGFKQAPQQTWVVHGEPKASHALLDRIKSDLGWANAQCAEAGQQVVL